MKLQVLLLHLSTGVLAGPCEPYGPISSMQQHGTIPNSPSSTQTASVPSSMDEPPSPTHTNSDIFASGVSPIGVSQSHLSMSDLVSSVLSSTLANNGAGGQPGSPTSKEPEETTSDVTKGGDANGVQTTMTNPTIIHGTLTSDGGTFPEGSVTSTQTDVRQSPGSPTDTTGSLAASASAKPVEHSDIDTTSLAPSETASSVPSDDSPISGPESSITNDVSATSNLIISSDIPPTSNPVAVSDTSPNLSVTSEPIVTSTPIGPSLSTATSGEDLSNPADSPSAIPPTSDPNEPSFTTSGQPPVSQTTEPALSVPLSSDQNAPSDTSESSALESSAPSITSDSDLPAISTPVVVSDADPSFSVTSDSISTATPLGPIATTAASSTTSAGGSGGVIGGGTGGSGGGTGGGSTGGGSTGGGGT
ncbi:hypothetical protein FSPOR_10443, partial [Fusarium sporotrichioides]